MMTSIRKAAESFGVSIETVRRWEREGKLKSSRTPGGHRRYNLNHLRIPGIENRKRPDSPPKRKTLVYARVSS